ncbi:DUF2784 domain-containing protein [Aquiflexum sp.]|uniref:DUF2784 domain-containing protein n=1 Tax=Aquiflexum sp. TaxID=1872584 RepID=UPI003593B091
MLQIADIFFTVFHTLLILFNLFAWIWKPLRKWHFASISLTLASWAILGIWYGWGYCPLTDWHWDILREMSKTELPNSYITFLIKRLTGQNPDPGLVDIMTLFLALLAFAISIKVNFFPKKTS